MNKIDLTNYIKLCKISNLSNINKIYDELSIKTNEMIHQEYNIPIEYISSIRIINNNGYTKDELKRIYDSYYKMIGGKGGKGENGVKGRDMVNNKSNKINTLKNEKINIFSKDNKNVKNKIIGTINGITKNYRETGKLISSSGLLNESSSGLSTGIIIGNIQSTTAGMLSDINILKTKIDEINRTMLTEFSKNNITLTTITNEIKNINNKIDMINKK
jgi:hypothetical protein